MHRGGMVVFMALVSLWSRQPGAAISLWSACFLSGRHTRLGLISSKDSEAVVAAAMNGHKPIIQMLLDQREHEPRADCRDGEALVRAAENGHKAVDRLLLEQREHAPRADSMDGMALVRAAQNGHETVVRLLLEC